MFQREESLTFKTIDRGFLLPDFDGFSHKLHTAVHKGHHTVKSVSLAIPHFDRLLLRNLTHSLQSGGVQSEF